ncbi:polysaccharide deacetylase family protein [Streptomyces sp. CA-288835]|uniref:polysaccharide deacetylase family protein n=1 Tax=Streptomyces sp. CA-288835 TaxID=3240069 RepID=UPI003D93157C
MRSVRQDGKVGLRRALATAVLTSALLAAGATGCARPIAPAEHLDRLDKKATSTVGAHSVPAATYRRWGLPAPLAPAPEPPARPAVRPAGPGLPPVVDRVPTRDKVVFLTFDDGAERDPRFVDLVRELRLPVSMFLTDSVVGPGYAHFGRLRAAGASVQNHTLDHPYLPGLPYAGQRAEICGQQDKLKHRFGIRPHLFRPPYGAYNHDTLRAAADCGVAAVVLWSDAKRLRPGDILHCPEGRDGATLAETTTRMLNHIQRQGFTVARLEDYL